MNLLNYVLTILNVKPADVLEKKVFGSSKTSRVLTMPRVIARGMLIISVGTGMLLFHTGKTPTVFAQQLTQLSVSPVTFDLTANPGDTLTNQMKVTNLSSGTLQLETRTENIAAAGQEGQVQLTEEETEFSLSKWVETTPKKLTLDSKDTKVINFTIHVPNNAEPGGHYGSILVGTTASDVPNSTGASVAQRVGTLLLVKVSGKSKEEAVVKQFRSKTYVGQWNEIVGSDGKTKFLTPKDEETNKEKFAKYFQKGPIAFEAIFHNAGNVHVKPTGSVIVYNLFNRQIAQLPLDQRNIFPGNDRRIMVIWPTGRLWGIYYRAQLAAVYGTTNQPLIASIGIWVFPLPVAIALGVILLIVLIFRRRLIRAVRILVKGG